MSTKIKPGAWTGWPPFEVTARLQDSEEDGPWPPGTRIVVVELTIGGVTAAQALTTLYDEPGETADLLISAVVDQLFEFMATHYPQADHGRAPRGDRGAAEGRWVMDDLSAIVAAEGDGEIFEAHGLECRMLRNRFGAWCGYVGVPPGHPLHGAGWMDASGREHGGRSLDSIEVHGGVTFAAAHGDMLWWIGFDCSHCDDWTPKTTRHPGQIYRTKDYARAETERLARQLAEMKEPA